MTGAGRGDDYLGEARERIEDEVLVWGVGEKTGSEGQNVPIRFREEARDSLPQHLLVLLGGYARKRIGLTPLPQMVIETDLEARHGPHRKLVEVSEVALEIRDRKRAKAIKLGRARPEPAEHLPNHRPGQPPNARQAAAI